MLVFVVISAAPGRSRWIRPRIARGRGEGYCKTIPGLEEGTGSYPPSAQGQIAMPSSTLLVLAAPTGDYQYFTFIVFSYR